MLSFTEETLLGQRWVVVEWRPQHWFTDTFLPPQQTQRGSLRSGTGRSHGVTHGDMGSSDTAERALKG